jgi:hypothetical protein
MKPLDPEVLQVYFDLKKMYLERFNPNGLEEYKVFPKEFFEIRSYATLSKLLKEALEKNVRLEDLDYIRQLQERNTERKITEGIEELRNRRSK